MDWPQLSQQNLETCRDIANYRQDLDRVPNGAKLRLRLASMGDAAGRLMMQFIKHKQVTRIFEIGTCAGIGAAYMCAAAEGNGRVNYVGMEGMQEKIAIAQETFKRFCPNTSVQIIAGRFDETFEHALHIALPLQFVYIDGYHKREPTLRMFNRCTEEMPQGGIIVCDDLQWSTQGDARKKLMKHARVIAHGMFAKKDFFTIGAIDARDRSRDSVVDIDAFCALV